MSTPDSDVKQWLEDLQRADRNKRLEAAHQLEKWGSNTRTITGALEHVSANDADAAVRLAAEVALLAITHHSRTLPSGRVVPKDKLALTSRQKYLRLAIGFVGWYLVNGLVWLPFNGSATKGEFALLINVFILPINLAILLILGLIRRTRWVALGILTALAFNLAVALIIGAVINGVCFVPFFIK